MKRPNLIPQMHIFAIGRNKIHKMVMIPCELQIMVDMEKKASTVQKIADRASDREMCLPSSAPAKL